MKGRQKELFEALYTYSEMKEPQTPKTNEQFMKNFHELIDNYPEGVEEDERWDGINDLARYIIPNYREII